MGKLDLALEDRLEQSFVQIVAGGLILHSIITVFAGNLYIKESGPNTLGTDPIQQFAVRK